MKTNFFKEKKKRATKVSNTNKQTKEEYLLSNSIHEKKLNETKKKKFRD